MSLKVTSLKAAVAVHVCFSGEPSGNDEITVFSSKVVCLFNVQTVYLKPFLELVSFILNFYLRCLIRSQTISCLSYCIYFK